MFCSPLVDRRKAPSKCRKSIPLAEHPQVIASLLGKFFGLLTREMGGPSGSFRHSRIAAVLSPPLSLFQNFPVLGIIRSQTDGLLGQTEGFFFITKRLSLIHISEPTRRTPI